MYPDIYIAPRKSQKAISQISDLIQYLPTLK